MTTTGAGSRTTGALERGPPAPRWLPAMQWLREYRRPWLRADAVAGVTLAAYLIPAGMGGPAVIAFPSACPNAHAGQAWPVFVESIEIVPKGDGP